MDHLCQHLWGCDSGLQFSRCNDVRTRLHNTVLIPQHLDGKATTVNTTPQQPVLKSGDKMPYHKHRKPSSLAGFSSPSSMVCMTIYLLMSDVPRGDITALQTSKQWLLQEALLIHGKPWVTARQCSYLLRAQRLKSKIQPNPLKICFGEKKKKKSQRFALKSRMIKPESCDLPQAFAHHPHTILFQEMHSSGHQPFLKAEPLAEDESIGQMVTQAPRKTENELI